MTCMPTNNPPDPDFEDDTPIPAEDVIEEARQRRMAHASQMSADIQLQTIRAAHAEHGTVIATLVQRMDVLTDQLIDVGISDQRQYEALAALRAEFESVKTSLARLMTYNSIGPAPDLDSDK